MGGPWTGRSLWNEPDTLVFDNPVYKPYDYQQEAIEAIEAEFKNRERGKLILPCGTGKSVVGVVGGGTDGGRGRTSVVCDAFHLVDGSDHARVGHSAANRATVHRGVFRQ